MGDIGSSGEGRDHTFQDCCKNVIMQTSSSSVWGYERNDLYSFYTLLGFRRLQRVVGMTDRGSNPSGARDSLHHSHSFWPWGPSSLLHIEYLASFLGINWLCVVRSLPSPSIAKVKNYYSCISSPPLYQWWYITLTLSLALLGLHHRIVTMFDVEETKSHSGITLQTESLSHMSEATKQ